MQKAISLVVHVVGILVLLSIPTSSRADLVVGPTGAFTFENQQKLSVKLSTGGQELATTSLDTGTELDLAFSMSGDNGTYPTNDDLVSSLEDQRTYFEVWNGEPFNSEALPVFSKELGTSTTGEVKIILSSPGKYFIVVYQTNEVRDAASYCAKYEVLAEDCADPNYFIHFSHEDTQEYFKTSHTTFETSPTAWPTVFGGTRIIAAGSEKSSAISSVLFLPGIKGSKLYTRSPLCVPLVGHCDVPLWLPIEDAAVPELFMDSTGHSIHDDVYAKEGNLLSEALGEKFYATFADDMNHYQADGTFGTGWSWKPIAYDWRLSLPDIITNGLERDGRIYFEEASTTPYIEQSLRELASTSPTGKVTIIAHSNGGLVAKALMQKLGNEETSRLIDKVLFVGVPQSGAPRAYGALLFGDQEGLPGIPHMPNFLMSVAHAREFAENSPMAYHLLPSNAYFNKSDGVTHPLLTFSGEDTLMKDELEYGGSVWGMQEMESYGEALAHERAKPDPKDITKPNILNAPLLDYGREIHNSLDDWKPPAGVKVYQIAGWGAETISGIELYEQLHIHHDGVVEGTLDYRPLFEYEGDGTVPAQSGLMMSVDPQVQSYWEDLQPDAHGNHEYTHGDLFEIPEVRTLLADTMQNNETLPTTVYDHEPAVREQPTYLFFFLHSPASLSVTNSNGRVTSIDGSGLGKQEIPGSEYREFGELKYVRVPAGFAYHLHLAGEADGSATLDLQLQRSGQVLQTSTISDIPLTTRTIADADISLLVASSTLLSIDEDGDGMAELQAAFNEGTTTFPRAATPAQNTTSPTKLDTTHSKGRSTASLVPRTYLSIQAHIARVLLPASYRPEVDTVAIIKTISGAHNSAGTASRSKDQTPALTKKIHTPTELVFSSKPSSLLSRLTQVVRKLIHSLAVLFLNFIPNLSQAR